MLLFKYYFKQNLFQVLGLVPAISKTSSTFAAAYQEKVRLELEHLGDVTCVIVLYYWLSYQRNHSVCTYVCTQN